MKTSNIFRYYLYFGLGILLQDNLKTLYCGKNFSMKINLNELT